MRRVIEMAGKTNHKYGRATDDLRSLIQSIVLASLDSPQSPDQQRKIPPKQQQANALGLPLSRYNRILSSAKFKRTALEEERKDTIYSQVIKGKGWTKVDSNLMEIVHKWIRAHPHVIESPLANDTVKVPDKNDPTKKVKTNRLLLQISIRELHNDMLEQLPEVKDAEGNVLISDTKLRQIMPPEVKRMSNRYKVMCGCIDCLHIQYYQSDYNRFKNSLMKKMVDDRDKAPLRSTERSLAAARVVIYENEIQNHPKPKDAL